MGFAVVADEVRNLAQRCAQAARDTSELIEESITRSNQGKARLDHVVDSITKVVRSSAQVKTLANEVHVSSQEQARGIEQIARAITQMQQVTQSTAASAEQSASAGEQMKLQSQRLHGAVQLLQQLVGAARSTSPPVPATPSPARDLSMLHAAVRRDTAPRIETRSLSPEAVIPLDDGFQDF
jgi:di/tripeptidase